MPTKNDQTWFNEQANRAMFRQELAKVAKREIGTVESPAGSNLTKYGAWFGLNGMAWCGQFVSWVYQTASANLSVPNPLARLTSPRGFAHCTTAYAAAKKLGITVDDNEPLLPGDVVIWDHDKLPGGPGHTGLLVAVKAKRMVSVVEGNTNPSFSNSGGSVQRHEHDLRAAPDFKGHGRLVGVIRPTRRWARP